MKALETPRTQIMEHTGGEVRVRARVRVRVRVRVRPGLFHCSHGHQSTWWGHGAQGFGTATWSLALVLGSQVWGP